MRLIRGGQTPNRGVSMFWELDCLWWFQTIHNVLEMGSEYVSMNAVIVQNDRPTTRSLSARVGDRTPWPN